MKERCFKFDPMVDQTVTHFASDGWLLHKGGEDARKQAEADRAAAEAAAKFAADVERAAREKEAGLDVDVPDDSRQLRNQASRGCMHHAGAVPQALQRCYTPPAHACLPPPAAVQLWRARGTDVQLPAA